MNTIGWCQLPLGWRVVSPLTEDPPSLQLILFYVHTFVLWGGSWCRRLIVDEKCEAFFWPQITPVTSSEKTSLNNLATVASGCNFTLIILELEKALHYSGMVHPWQSFNSLNHICEIAAGSVRRININCHCATACDRGVHSFYSLNERIVQD